jgi:hypothetical protein
LTPRNIASNDEKTTDFRTGARLSASAKKIFLGC